MDAERLTVPLLLHRHADTTPDLQFVVTEDDALTYREVERASNRLAARLVREGIGKGTRVGLLMPNGCEWALTAISQALFWPEPMLAFLQAEASRLDCSLSNVVQRAWKQARETIAALPDRDAAAARRESYPSAQNQKQTLYFPTEMLAEAEAEAARFDSSLSWLFQLAISIAKA